MTHHSLSDLERAEALPFTQAPRFRPSEKLVLSTTLSLLAGGRILMRAGHGIAAWALLFACTLGLFVFAVMLSSRRRTQPRITRAPREIKRAYLIYMVAAMSIWLVAYLLVPLLPQPWAWIGVGVTFLLMYGIFTAFDTLYARAVRDVEARLGE